MSKYNDRTEANISTLEPAFAGNVRGWLQAMRNTGYLPYIYFGYRTPAQQEELHQAFVNGKGPRAVSPRASYHCYGLAFDWVNLDKDGNPNWDDDAAYVAGWKVATAFRIRGIGEMDNDHIQDGRFPTYQDIPEKFYGNPKG